MSKLNGPRISCCSTPRNTNPATIHLAHFHTVNVYKELTFLAQTIVEGLGIKNPMARAFREAEFVGTVRGQLRSLAKGQLPTTTNSENPELKPSVTQPDIWEVKYPKLWEESRMQLRFYHGEPLGSGPDVVVVLFRSKQIDKLSDIEIATRQNRDMRDAQYRFDDGRPYRWGHTRRCRDCISST